MLFQQVSVAEIETRSVRHVTLEAIDAAAAEGRTLKVVCHSANSLASSFQFMSSLSRSSDVHI